MSSEMITKDYFIGLDIGTDSVGWAVTDTEYNLLRARGNDLWGSYLFSESQTAEERRKYRGARRRLARVRHRLMLLQTLFKEEIEKVDPLFFIRLNDSKFLLDDKNKAIGTKNIFFNDESFKDKDYYKKYPTIFHLRYDLMKNPAKDIRLLYLAVHHIIKNRGHFLFEGQDFSISNTEIVKQAFIDINTHLSDRGYSTLSLENLEDCIGVLIDGKATKKDKQSRLKELFNTDKDKQLNSIISAVTGGNVNIKDLFSKEEETGAINKFSFDSSDFEKIYPQIEEAVGADDAALALKLKTIYDWSILSNILKGCNSISEAKIKDFEKHKSDLKKLKKYIEEKRHDLYNETFRYRENVNNYAKYIGKDRKKDFSKCTKEDFYTFLKNTVKIDDKEILTEIEKGTFMQKQTSNANSTIPYQVHLSELQAILQNARKHFSFLSLKSDELNVTEKIESLMTYRIPYYVGPLNTASKFSWVVKYDGQEKTKITPWNFDKVIDKDASEEAFIQRMTSKCTYLPTEDVLPASSFLYSEFTFLNELNNLKIFGEKNKESNEKIYNYAKSHKKITLKAVMNLLNLPNSTKKEEVFSGIDGDFKNSLSSYIDFKNIIGDKADTESQMCEEIIKWITLISDKDRLENRIRKKYGNKLSAEEIKKIKGLNYSKWGRLSRRFLELKGVDKETGQLFSVIDAMRQSGNNLMQLLSDKFTFLDEINAYNSRFEDSYKVTYSAISELYCSPSVKKAIWRTICLVDEIVKINGKNPKKIFIEMARGVEKDQKGVRTVSRQQQLIHLFNNLKGEKRNWVEEINNTDAGKFNSEKVVLYYRQLGRCMYTGNPISFDSLFNTNIYDIDHIYPQSEVKDDSIENKVLVEKTANMLKKNIYPISADIRGRMKSFWSELHSKKLIGDEKYYRLTRSTPLSQSELIDFINRQLVETRQSTKIVADILKKVFKNTEIVYVKAKNTAEFKNENNIIKIRELNDLHHAKDAYINIAVGNVYNTKFGHNAAVYLKNDNKYKYDLRRLFDEELKDAWKLGYKQKIISAVKRNTCVITKQTAKGKGKLFDVNPVSAKDNLIPLKAKGPLTDTSKYGGYHSATTSYFMLVKSINKKGKAILSLEAIPLHIDYLFKKDKAKLTDYCRDSFGLINPKILIDEIKINTLFNIDGADLYIRGVTGNNIIWCNANQLYLDEESAVYLKRITSYFDSIKKLNKKDIPVSEQYDKITREHNIRIYDVFIDKLSDRPFKYLTISKNAEILREKRSLFENLTLENQCKVIMEILHFMQCNSAMSNLKLIESFANLGIIRTDKKIQDKKVKIIFQSPTGYYKKIIDVNKLL